MELDKRKQVIDKVFRRVTDKKLIYECSLLVEEGQGEFPYSKEYNGKTIDTPMIMASVTKLFTTTCIMILYELGKISLEDKLTKYFEGHMLRGLHTMNGREYALELTIHDLLCQTSVFPDGYNESKEAGGFNTFFQEHGGVVGHFGSTGSFAYYYPDKDLYFTGDINQVSRIDLDIDGVDEIDSDFNAIKGGGGALYREKVIASIADEIIWIMDDSKLVKAIGKFPLPIEVSKFGSKQVYLKMKEYGFNPVQRVVEDEVFVTDNGNYIYDLHLKEGFNIEEVKDILDHTVGILEHGLFLNMCKRIVVGKEDGVDVIENDTKRGIV